MNLHRRLLHVALGAGLGCALLLSAGSPAFADKDYGPACHDRLNADKARIDRDSHRFGEGSRQVQHDVDKMDSDREWCKSHKADWDHSMFDIGIYMHK